MWRMWQARATGLLGLPLLRDCHFKPSQTSRSVNMGLFGKSRAEKEAERRADEQRRRDAEEAARRKPIRDFAKEFGCSEKAAGEVLNCISVVRNEFPQWFQAPLATLTKSPEYPKWEVIPKDVIKALNDLFENAWDTVNDGKYAPPWNTSLDKRKLPKFPEFFVRLPAFETYALLAFDYWISSGAVSENQPYIKELDCDRW